MRMLKPLAVIALTTVTVGDRPLFSTDRIVDLTLEAPLREIFDKGASDDKFSARGVLPTAIPSAAQPWSFPKWHFP